MQPDKKRLGYVAKRNGARREGEKETIQGHAAWSWSPPHSLVLCLHYMWHALLQLLYIVMTSNGHVVVNKDERGETKGVGGQLCVDEGAGSVG